MTRDRILIVGGSDAGTSAALSARAIDPECAIDVLLDDRFPNFSVCGIPFLLSGEVRGWQELAHRSEEDFARRSINLHNSTELSVRHERREVVAATPGGEKAFGYDQLVIATGAEAVTPKFPGAELSYTPPLGSPWDPWQAAVRAWCDEWSNGRAVTTQQRGARHEGHEEASAVPLHSQLGAKPDGRSLLEEGSLAIASTSKAQASNRASSIRSSSRR